MTGRRYRARPILAVTISAVGIATAVAASAARAAKPPAAFEIPRHARMLLTAPERAQTGPTTLYAQRGADGVKDVYVQGNPPICRPGATTVSQWFANKFARDGKNVPIRWKVGDFTGFYPKDPAASQVGLTDAKRGGTAIQLEGGISGWLIDTETAASNAAAANPSFIAGIIGNHQTCDDARKVLPVKPFAKPYEILIYSLDLQVPHSDHARGSVNTASQMIFITDPTVPPAGLGFWYSFADYSSVPQTEQVIYDAGTDAAIVGAFPGTVGNFSTDAGGAPMQTSTFTGYRNFRVAVTPQNLRNAVAAVKAAAGANPKTYSKYLRLSDDPSVYQFGGGILDTEVARAGKHDGSMGLSSRNARIELLSGGAGCGPANTEVAWTCGNGRPDSSWTSAGDGCFTRDSGQPCRERIIGHVDATQRNADGSVTLDGWACALASDRPLKVSAYAGGLAPAGRLGTAVASASSEPAVAKACLDPGESPHRFSLRISPATAASYRGRAALVVGSLGPESASLARSGELKLP